MVEYEIEVLVKKLKHHDPDVRFDAVKALELVGGVKVVPHIAFALRDDNGSVVFIAEQALMRLGSMEAEAALLDYKERVASTAKTTAGKLSLSVADSTVKAVVSRRSFDRYNDDREYYDNEEANRLQEMRDDSGYDDNNDND